MTRELQESALLQVNLSTWMFLLVGVNETFTSATVCDYTLRLLQRASRVRMISHVNWCIVIQLVPAVVYIWLLNILLHMQHRSYRA